MAWVELELDERTFRLLSARAKRDGLSIAEALRRIATREVCRGEDSLGYLSLGRLSADPVEVGHRIRAVAGQGDV